MPTVKVRTKQNQKKVSKKHLKKNDNNVDKLTGSRLKSSEFSKVEDELIQTVDKLSRVGLQEYATYLSHPFRIFWTNLLAGTARGLGFLFGAAIVLAVISYVFAILIDLPVVGKFFVNLNEFLEQSTNIYIQGD
ncbi:hypothetical protein A2335_00540 [Candidatus Peregrinibacteria bacterium RIFOXYB2_FULL_32_7]|nr:MAG: hypothetical protein A2335_00540 [Candidatus Peregrinibacteria bacterium RIFOXYB2_FULL_32_7]